MAYNFVSSSMFVVFAVVVNCRFAIAAVRFVGKLSFVIIVRKPWVGVFCNKFVGVV